MTRLSADDLATRWDDVPTEDRYGPGDPPLRVRLTPRQADRWRRQIDDPWAAYMVNGRCVGCAGGGGHGSACPYLLNPNHPVPEDPHA